MKRLSTSKSVLPAGPSPRLGNGSIIIQLDEIPLLNCLEHFSVEGSLLGGRRSSTFDGAGPDFALRLARRRIRLSLAFPLAARRGRLGYVKFLTPLGRKFRFAERIDL